MSTLTLPGTLPYIVSFGLFSNLLVDPADLTLVIGVDPGPRQEMASQIRQAIVEHLREPVGSWLQVWLFPDGDLPEHGVLHGARGKVVHADGQTAARFTLAARVDLSYAVTRPASSIQPGYYVQTTPGDHFRKVASVIAEGGPAGSVRGVALTLDDYTDQHGCGPHDFLLSRTPLEHQRHLAVVALTGRAGSAVTG